MYLTRTPPHSARHLTLGNGQRWLLGHRSRDQRSPHIDDKTASPFRHPLTLQGWDAKKWQAHVTEYIVPEMVEAAARDAVFFEPIFPQFYDVRPTSFFGGLPLLPPEMDWPVSNIVVDINTRNESNSKRQITEILEPVAPTFLGQIDLRALPHEADTSPLPKEGTLYFFFDSATLDMDLPGTPGTGGRVLYWPGDSSTFEERGEPALLRDCYGDAAYYCFRWLNGPPYPKRFAKWPVRPIPVRTFDVPFPESALAPDDEIRAAMYRAWDQYNDLIVSRQAEALAAALPEPVERNYFVSASARVNWRGGEGFPYTWICVEVFVMMMLNHIDDHTKRSKLREEYQPELLNAQCLEWLERSRASGLYKALSSQARQDFWQWYEAVIASSSDDLKDGRHWIYLQKCLEEAYRVGPRLCLSESAAAAALIPPFWIEDQRWQFAINITGHGGRVITHCLLGSRAETDPPSPDHVLLMQFDSQEGLDWLWCDVGVVQYWITMADLEALRFENVIVHTHGG